MKTKWKSKITYTKKINSHVPSRWCVHSTFRCGDVIDPMKMYLCKGCVEKFVGYSEDEIKKLFETFLQQPMTELTHVLKRQHKASKGFLVSFKEFAYSSHKPIIVSLSVYRFVLRSSTQQLQPETWNTRWHSRCVSWTKWLWCIWCIYQGARK